MLLQLVLCVLLLLLVLLVSMCYVLPGGLQCLATAEWLSCCPPKRHGLALVHVEMVHCLSESGSMCVVGDPPYVATMARQI
jgi:hypothetical protein